jgi:hypothetical protein
MFRRNLVEDLSKHERLLTPPALCAHLCRMVRTMGAGEVVAVLWACEGTHYARLQPGVVLFGVNEDANTYNGPWPIIAHPPCGPWGKFKWRSRQSKQDGVNAMRLVHRWGGVVEQPSGSSLFAEHGGRGAVQKIRQSDYGHPAPKATLLYWSMPLSAGAVR